MPAPARVRLGPSLIVIDVSAAGTTGAARYPPARPLSSPTPRPARRTPWCRAGRRDRACAIAARRSRDRARPRSPPPRCVRRASSRRSPSQASSIAAEPISEAGLARSCPAMSGAEPCCACAIACAVAGIERGGEPEAAADLRGEVRQDVAEHVGGHHHVERAGVAHQQRRHRIHDPLLVVHGREARRHRAHAFEKQSVRHPQHVGLVHRRHLVAAARAPARRRPRRSGSSPCA